MDTALYNELSEIHTWAKHHFVYTPDSIRWKESVVFDEHWETREEIENELRDKGYVKGDCDAFAMMCWMACRKSKIKARLVFCTVGILGGNDGHLVCEANGYILDNRMPVVMTNTDLEKNYAYVFISKSGYEPGEQWTEAYADKQ